MGGATPDPPSILVPNVQVQGRCAALSRSVPWNEGFGGIAVPCVLQVFGRKARVFRYACEHTRSDFLAIDAPEYPPS